MKKLIGAALALFATATFGTTLVPIQLLNPTGSSSGQAIVSTGASSAPAWGGVGLNGIAPIAANSVLANATGSSASPTAVTITGTGFAVFNNSPALAGTPTSPTASTGTSNTQVATTAFVANTFAAPPCTGCTTPNTGKFTTLSTTAQSKVAATTSNALSIPNNSFTTVTTWTAALNQGSNFTTSTGVYTTPAAGTYDVRFSFKLAAATYAAGNGIIAAIYDNGAEVYQTSVTIPSAATSVSVGAAISASINCASGDLITVRAFQNSGGAVALDGNSFDNWVTITQQP